MALPPAAIAAAAKADVARWVYKRDHPRSDPFAPYAFHRDHVAAARDAEELVALAIAQPRRGINSFKRNTRLIYGDVDALWGALAILRGASSPAEDAG